MAVSNHQRVGIALELLQQGLKPYVERELREAYGDQLEARAAASLQREQIEGEFDLNNAMMDVKKLLFIMWDHWNEVFRKTLGHTERSVVSELREARNNWAHQQKFSTDAAYRVLDSISILLTAIASSKADEVEKQKHDILRKRFAEQARQEKRRKADAPLDGQPSSGLPPWRELITPHPDVSSGKYMQAEFAADLWQVYLGEGSDEYREPNEFFRRTFLTQGLQKLLIGAVQRLSGAGSDPVVELQTNFGGGKTHSLLALYHLFSGVSPGELAGVEELLTESGLELPGGVKRAVLVGNKISPAEASIKPHDGPHVHTLWGELAWQLGGAEAYEMVRADDEAHTSPGDKLRILFNRYAPCMILIDEWVAYARQLHDRADLAGGSFETHFTFAQSITEAAKGADRTLLVVSLPASDIELGGEKGKEALNQLKNAVERVAVPWRPAGDVETFEIVRRRLFEDMDSSNYAARDSVIKEFMSFYRDAPQDFPTVAQEADYEQHMLMAYPVHPELFEDLYSEWSSLEKFQRTRGVLRLMAAAIHALWIRNDNSLLIMPSSMPIDDGSVQFELTRYLEDNWVPVIERDVDGPSSLPLKLDQDNPNLGRYSATRRVARAIYMGTAPTGRGNNPGLDENRIKLGCVQPGEAIPVFGDALRRLSDSAMHLYVDRSRYWYSIQPTVARIALQISENLDEEDVYEELKSRLRLRQDRGEFAAIHAVPETSGDVPDNAEVRLVILGPQYVHSSQADSSPALTECKAILNSRENAPRLYKNMLIFLAPQDQRLGELSKSIRQYLAWKMIHNDREEHNLDAFQMNQAQTKRNQFDEQVAAGIKETYTELLVPHQPDAGVPESLQWDTMRLRGSEDLAVRASRKLKDMEHMITGYSAIRLRMEIDQYNLLEDEDHIKLKQLWKYFARYPYLERLRDHKVLVGAIQDGISQLTWMENFAYAAGWDSDNNRYLNLKAGVIGSFVLMDNDSLLVSTEAAKRQLEAESEVVPPPSPDGGDTGGEEVGGTTPTTVTVRRFHGIVKLDQARLARDAGRIGDEIVHHLASLRNAGIEITLEIHAEMPEGVPHTMVRTVTENAHVLNFDNFGFEEGESGD